MVTQTFRTKYLFPHLGVLATVEFLSGNFYWSKGAALPKVTPTPRSIQLQLGGEWQPVERSGLHTSTQGNSKGRSQLQSSPWN